jgi:tubulin-specific chaperone D
LTAHFFPHEVDDLLPVLDLLELSSEQDSVELCWELRYSLVLWLSLVCMIPFDLKNFDVGRATSKDPSASTVSRLIALSKRLLGSPGKDRDAAVVVFGRLFQR